MKCLLFVLFWFIGCIRSTDTKKGWQLCIESNGVYVWMVIFERVLMKKLWDHQQPLMCWHCSKNWHWVFWAQALSEYKSTLSLCLWTNQLCVLFYGRWTLECFTWTDFSCWVWSCVFWSYSLRSVLKIIQI